MGTIVDKFNYSFEAKDLIKDSINNLGGSITSETELKEYAQELDNIYDNLPKTIGEGSNLSLTTLKGKMNIIPKGNIEQDTTTGSQLIDFSTLGNSNTTNSFTNDVLTVSTSSGTYANAYKDITDLYKANTGKVLRFDFSSITYDVTPNVRIVGLRIVSGSTSNVTLVDNNKTISTHTIPNDVSSITQVVLTIYANNTNTPTTNTLKITKPILHFGSSSQDYEEYTGLQTSPNPTCPQDIEVVTGTQEVKVENVNLLANGVAFTKSTAGWYDQLGNETTTLAQVQASTNYYDLKGGTTYTLKVHNYTNINRCQIIYISNGSLSAFTTISNLSDSATFTPTTDTRVWFRAEMTNTNTNTLMQPQLEKRLYCYSIYTTPRTNTNSKSRRYRTM